MNRIPAIDECDFRAEQTRAGKFVGRVDQFPDLRTPPQRTSIDAVDEIVTMVRERLRDIHSARAGFGPAPITTEGTR